MAGVGVRTPVFPFFASESHRRHPAARRTDSQVRSMRAVLHLGPHTPEGSPARRVSRVYSTECRHSCIDASIHLPACLLACLPACLNAFRSSLRPLLSVHAYVRACVRMHDACNAECVHPYIPTQGQKSKQPRADARQNDYQPASQVEMPHIQSAGARAERQADVDTSRNG